MIVDFPLPELGPEVPAATIITWCKNVGDMVSPGEVLLEVMSEKVNIEVESDITGRLVEIVCRAEEEVAPGTVVARFEAAE
ncbi:pyruvate/2-oxoglutarate dehydrogenase complex dihydrolipoamide acyltransferase (E2) component [Mycoplana sp. BE70]|uniref:biotin/lipoyl-containing protein n=1 Tax=Mycoplana sp. BE70 TaxID=2817775 RepID=UPI002855BE54|nr:biotin/lipoyl-containing protein [Mycoplana sp. BE70]MDR6758781.1 pyruvate/2-oxoglutarate dehydrogenase complex dihydrolipoamide acyltransferase (E2) component [Mycoplana sp. BE70]